MVYLTFAFSQIISIFFNNDIPLCTYIVFDILPAHRSVNFIKRYKISIERHVYNIILYEHARLNNRRLLTIKQNVTGKRLLLKLKKRLAQRLSIARYESGFAPWSLDRKRVSRNHWRGYVIDFSRDFCFFFQGSSQKINSKQLNEHSNLITLTCGLRRKKGLPQTSCAPQTGIQGTNTAFRL